MYSVTTYYALAIGALAALAIVGLRPVLEEQDWRSETRRRRTLVFWLIAAATLVAWAWPAVALNQQINPDESMFLALAHLAGIRPMPWRDFDPTSSGPLNIWPLTLVHLLGLGLTFATARILEIALVLLGAYALYRSMDLLFGEAAANLSCVCAIGFYATASYDPSFAHYSSETIPSVLIAFLGLTTVKLAKEPRRSIAFAGLAGLLAGGIPLAKLQAAPIGAALAAVASAIIIARNSPLREKFAATAALVLCSFVIPAAVLLPVAISGAWNDFLTSYVRAALWWTGTTAPRLSKGPIELGAYPSFFFLILFLVPLAVGMLALGTLLRRPAETVGSSLRALAPAAAILLAIVAGVYAVGRAHETLGHHLLLLVNPVCALTASSFAFMMATSRRADIGRAIAVALTGAFVVCSAVMAARIGNAFLALGDPASPYHAKGSEIATPSELALVKMIPRRASLTVWGWAPEVYVLSGATMGTRDAITQFQMWPGPYEKYFLDRYLADLRRYRPEYFLDTIRGFKTNHWHLTAPENRLQNYGPAASYVAAHYTLTAEADGLRLYRRI